ncbi:DNA adenine methylase [Phytopseudomonas daroniae]|uniref:DNA adenine methylase n=1 Tax=Phytopseudomonas daroniae TaxID=2487519 RepID=UPI0010385DE0|nr:DNA adenine methylase [Pseudomonas daroniae]TBU78197.1 methyltransferase [Pseudomonas daroniae]
MTAYRPLLRYHGGKWKLAPWIISHMADHRTYVEPFGGGGSVLLRKPRAYAEVYNDLDGDIVNLFRVARDHGSELQRMLYLTPFARSEFEISYGEVPDTLERARRMIVRSLQGFGSAAASGERTGFRASSSRSGTSPGVDWRNYPAALEAIIDRLQGVIIENRDALEVMAHHDRPTTLHYVDPPYVHSTRSAKVRHNDTGKSYRHELSDDQHRRLSAFLHGLAGMVIVSGYPCPLYEELFEDWHCIDRIAHADGARERVECLWLNPAAYQGIAQHDIFRRSMP